MTFKLASESPRRAAARTFGIRLRRDMARMKIGRRRLEKLTGVSDSSIANYRAGLSLPRLDSARRLADAMHDEELMAIITEGRTFICPIDKRTFTYNGEGPRVYCSAECQAVAVKMSKGQDTRADAFHAKRRVRVFAEAIDAMCRSCEPDGHCRTPDCPLRAVSPLPLRVPEEERPALR